MVSLHHLPSPAITRRSAWWWGRAASSTIWRPLSTVGVLTASAAVVLRFAAPGVLDRWSLVIGIIGILIGVPHGSVDHLVPFWQSGRRVTLRALIRVLVVYLLVGAAAAVAVELAPTATFAVFLVVSALHFGRAEVEFVAERAGRPPSPTIDGLRASAHGLTVVALPLAVWHERLHDILTRLAPALAGPVAGVSFTALAVVALGADIALLACDLSGHRNEEAVETVLLVVLMAVVPPVAAFGLYFGAWHALRHTARLLALPGPRGVPLPVGASVRRYLIHALPPTAVVLVALLALVAEGSESLLVSAVLVLLALTFPHMRTVAALDRSQHTERQSEVRR